MTTLQIARQCLNGTVQNQQLTTRNARAVMLWILRQNQVRQMLVRMKNN